MDRPGKPGGPDVIRVCEPECRDAFLMDLGMLAAGGVSGFRPRGAADVHVAWNDHDYRVTWHRHPLSAKPCDVCGEEWQARPGRVRVVPPPTEAQLRSREDFARRARDRATEQGKTQGFQPPGVPGYTPQPEHEETGPQHDDGDDALVVTGRGFLSRWGRRRGRGE
jgi:hypothetical protein